MKIPAIMPSGIIVNGHFNGVQWPYFTGNLAGITGILDVIFSSPGEMSLNGETIGLVSVSRLNSPILSVSFDNLTPHSSRSRLDLIFRSSLVSVLPSKLKYSLVSVSSRLLEPGLTTQRKLQ